MSNTAHLDLRQDQWTVALDAVTQEFRGASGKIEVLGRCERRQLETEGRPFQGISVDDREDERVVWIDFVDLSHAVREAKLVRLLGRAGNSGTVIEVEAGDGRKTILTLDGSMRRALDAHQL